MWGLVRKREEGIQYRMNSLSNQVLVLVGYFMCFKSCN